MRVTGRGGAIRRDHERDPMWPGLIYGVNSGASRPFPSRSRDGRSLQFIITPLCPVLTLPVRTSFRPPVEERENWLHRSGPSVSVHRKLFLCAAHIQCAATNPDPSFRRSTQSGTHIRTCGLPGSPTPPVIERVIGFPQVYSEGRNTYLPFITREAEYADAVAVVASGYRPFVVGKAGEVGLMQVGFGHARRLGYTGGVTGLFEPETNVRYGVMDLAQVWRLTNGDFCRALMKCRTEPDEVRIDSRSAEDCQRARGHLAAIGSPLVNGALTTTAATTPIVSDARGLGTRSSLEARSRRRFTGAPLRQTGGLGSRIPEAPSRTGQPSGSGLHTRHAFAGQSSKPHG